MTWSRDRKVGRSAGRSVLLEPDGNRGQEQQGKSDSSGLSCIGCVGDGKELSVG